MKVPEPAYIAKWASVLGCAFLMKAYYSTANVNGLRFILAPTTFVVETITGVNFTFEPYVGYMSADHTFLIAATCSGVNFLIAAFVMLAVGDLLGRRDGGPRWTFILRAALTAFAAAVMANTARISIAMQMQDWALTQQWMDPNDLHRLEGIVVYFGALVLLFIAFENGGTQRRFVQHRWFRYGLPLAVYYAVTLGIPVATGAFLHEPGFWKHGAFVALVPLVLAAGIEFVRRYHTFLGSHLHTSAVFFRRLPRP